MRLESHSLKNPFLNKIIAAGRLTRQGKLAEATLAIQRALSSGSQARTHTAASWPVGAGAAVVESPLVLDGLVREAVTPAPVIVFHGNADATVTPANGDAVIAATLHGVEAVAEKAPGHEAAGRRRVRRTVWRAADAGADAPTLAEHWLVEGAPHAWSGGAPDGSYTDPEGPDASREMLRFFLAHPRRRG